MTIFNIYRSFFPYFLLFFAYFHFPNSPPKLNCTHTRQIDECVFFILFESFGIIIPFKRPKNDNAGWLNYLTQNRDKDGNFCK